VSGDLLDADTAQGTADRIRADRDGFRASGVSLIRHAPGRRWPVGAAVATHAVPTDWVQAHPDAPFSFATEGIGVAVEQAQAIAGDRVVAVTAGTIARQCLELGLLDEVAVDLVPVVMGEGRPFFGKLSVGDVKLGDPTICIQSTRVTHMVFPVLR
jgi:hypothetical protein